MSRHNAEEIIENIEELLDEAAAPAGDGADGRRRQRRPPPSVFQRLDRNHLGPMRSHQAVDSIAEGAPLRFLKKALLRVMQLVARPQAAYNYHNVQALQSITHEVDQLRNRLRRYEDSEARPLGMAEYHRSDYSQLSNTIRQYLHYVRSNVDTMTHHLDDVGRTTSLMLDNLSAITSRLGRIDSVQKDLETGMASTRLDVSRLWTELGLVYESVDARAEDLWKALEERDDRIGSIHEGMDVHAGEFWKALADRDRQLEVNTEAARKVETASRELRARLLVLSEQMTIHQEMLDSMREEIERGDVRLASGGATPEGEKAPPQAREAGTGTAAAMPSASVPDRHAQQQLDLAYLRFQREYRGDEEELRRRQTSYIEKIESLLGEDIGERKPRVLDLACGDGVFLELVGERGWEARGVDLNEAMVKHGRSRNLPIEKGDALAFLEASSPKSWDVITAFQFVEHLQPDALMRLLRLGHRALRPGGVMLLETINPHTLKALHWFHLDLTHQRLIFPEMLQLLAETAGFVSPEWEAINPVSEDEMLSEDDASNGQANVRKLNSLLFGPQDYYLVARRSRGQAPGEPPPASNA